jgi:hypothetical protein
MNKYIIYISLGILLYLLINSLEGFSISATIWLKEIGTDYYVDAETLNLPLVPAPESQDDETTLLETVNHYLNIPPGEGGFQGHFELAPVDCVAQSSSPYMDEPTDVTLEAEISMAQDVRIQNKEIYCQLKQQILEKFNIIYGEGTPLIPRETSDDVYIPERIEYPYNDNEKEALANSLALSIIGTFINLTGQRIIFGGITTIRSLLNHNLDACAAISSCFKIDYEILDPVNLFNFIQIFVENFNSAHSSQNTINDNMNLFICFSIIFSQITLSDFGDVDNINEKMYIFMSYILKLYTDSNIDINQNNFDVIILQLHVMFRCYQISPTIRKFCKNLIIGFGGDTEYIPDDDIFQDFKYQEFLSLYGDYAKLFLFLSENQDFMNWYSKFCDTSDT